MGGLFYPKDTLISMFKTLCDKHPDKASYVSIGKSYQGRDIWLFKIGNALTGGRVMIDGSLHGWEDLGSVVQYLYAQWLLESNDPDAIKALGGNYTLLIPIVNMDSTERQNTDFTNCPLYGVDLNRNFVNGWAVKACNNYDYPGPNAASEPETKVMRAAFAAYKPKIYLNMHYGGGPYLSYYSGESAARINPILSRIQEISTQKGVTPYATHSDASVGFAIGDAHDAGAVAWIIEAASESSYHQGGQPANCPAGACYAHTCQTLADIQNYFFPKMLPIFLAFNEDSYVPPATTPPITPPTGALFPLIRQWINQWWTRLRGS